MLFKTNCAQTYDYPHIVEHVHDKGPWRVVRVRPGQRRAFERIQAPRYRSAGTVKPINA